MRGLLLHLIGMDQGEALWTLQRSSGKRECTTGTFLTYLERGLGHEFGDTLTCIISYLTRQPYCHKGPRYLRYRVPASASRQCECLQTR